MEPVFLGEIVACQLEVAQEMAHEDVTETFEALLAVQREQLSQQMAPLQKAPLQKAPLAQLSQKLDLLQSGSHHERSSHLCLFCRFLSAYFLAGRLCAVMLSSSSRHRALAHAFNK